MARPGILENHHVVVCGAGMAGLTAALTAAETGARVTLVEKGTTCGGSAALSNGTIWSPTRTEKLDELIPRGNRTLQSLVINTVQAGRDWLANLGVELSEPTRVHGFGTAQKTDPHQLIETLLHRFMEAGGHVFLESSLESLATERGRIIGVTIQRSDGAVDKLAAAAVVLATGGFQGSPELITRYIGPPDNLYHRSNPWSTGDGLIAALDIGAATSPGLDKFYGHAMLAPPTQFGPQQFVEASQLYGPRAVALNLRGQRFTDESRGTGEESLNQSLATQIDGRGFYILDLRIARQNSRQHGPSIQSILDRAKALGGNVVTAHSLEDLGTQLSRFGVPRDIAIESLQSYNRAAIGGRGSTELFPRRSRNADPLMTPPFFAVEVKASITFSGGGLAVDDRMRVLKRSARSSLLARPSDENSDRRLVPIQGLFAAGVDVGDIHHDGYIGGLATALTTGRIAGRMSGLTALGKDGSPRSRPT